MSAINAPKDTRSTGAAALLSARPSRPPMPKARPVQASGGAVCDVRAGSNAGDVSKRGWELASNGDLLGGLACHEAATALPSAGALNWFHRARTEQEAGMHGPAMSSYERAVNAVETRLRSTEALESYFQVSPRASHHSPRITHHSPLTSHHAPLSPRTTHHAGCRPVEDAVGCLRAPSVRPRYARYLECIVLAARSVLTS